MADERGELVLVTGGGGYVAGWCVVELLRQGYRVRTTVRSLDREREIRDAIAGQVRGDDRLTAVIADLTRDAGWDAAMAGCDYVLHVASPLGGEAGADLIAPAREGTLRVLRAAAGAGVRRVVMTSAAATARPPLDSNIVSNESVWASPDDPQFDSYRISKILAERAAWDFMAEAGATERLTTILPGAVFGPVLFKQNLGSVRIIKRLLEGRPPALPRLGFAVVDVRDLAALHVRAMTTPEAAGQRFLATGGSCGWKTSRARYDRSWARAPPTFRHGACRTLCFASSPASRPTFASCCRCWARDLGIDREARGAGLFSPRPASTDRRDSGEPQRLDSYGQRRVNPLVVSPEVVASSSADPSLKTPSEASDTCAAFCTLDS